MTIQPTPKSTLLPYTTLFRSNRGARHIKGGRRVLCRRVKEKYTSIKSRIHRFPVRTMCRVLGVHHSGFYAWLREPKSKREADDNYFLGYIKQFWLESGGVYGYRKVYKDLLAVGEHCGKNRVHRIMRAAEIQSQRSYKRKAYYTSGDISTVAPNLLNREFEVTEPNRVW